MRQFDNKKTDKVQRYVESLATGNFWKVEKDIDFQLQTKDADDDKDKKLQSNREFIDR